MQTLQLALFIVMLELTVGSFVSLYLLDLRGGTTRGFVVFQGALYLVFAGLTLLAMNSFATPELVHGYGLDIAWVRAQGPLTLLFSALLLVWNVLLWSDRQPKGAAKKVGRGAPGEVVPANPKRLARFGVGALTSLSGLVALFAVGMAYRTLADTHLGGAFVVLSFVAGGLAVGGVMTAMLLGHWYLNTPTASGKPLEFSTALVLVALVLELAFSLFIGPATPHSTLQSTTTVPGLTIQSSNGQLVVSTPTMAPAGTQAPAPQQQQTRQAPLSTGAMVWLQFIMGILAPLVLGAIALWLTRGRSFQSATGMLYLCVSFIFIGEILGRGLLVAPIFF